jgi:hypothetical protein
MTTQLFDKVFSTEFVKNCLEMVTGRVQTNKKEVQGPEQYSLEKKKDTGRQIK